jgi:DNA-binding transcriptional regulator GbsR (MarR family)
MPLEKLTEHNRMQREEGYKNQTVVFKAVSKESLRISDLLSVTGFRKPTLYKQLRYLQEHGFIFRDTIKSSEKSRYPVGTVVYRVAPNNQKNYFRSAIERSLGFLTEITYFDEKNAERVQKEIAKFIDSVARIMVDENKIAKDILDE